MYSINYSVNKKITNKLYKFIIFSLIIHCFFIIGFTIKWYTNIRHSTKAIDITLVTEKSKNKPTQADFMAQNNQLGGGNQNKKNNPTITEKNIFPDEIDKKINQTNQAKTVINDFDKKIKKKSNYITSKQNNNRAVANKDVNNSCEQLTEEADFIFQIESIPEVTSLMRNIEHRKNYMLNAPKLDISRQPLKNTEMQNI